VNVKRVEIPGPVAVVGLGRIGSALARALRSLETPPEVFGIEEDPLVGARALASGLVDRYDPEGVSLLPLAQTVVYAVPWEEFPRILRAQKALLPREAWVMDTLPLKGWVHQVVSSEGLSERFVGGHPMVSAEGEDDLFRGIRVWLTAEGGGNPDLQEKATAFWEALGGRVRWVEPDDHDRRLAGMAHLPRLISSAFAGFLDANQWSPEDLDPDSRSVLHLAAGDPEPWRALLPQMAGATGTGLSSVSQALNVLADLLARREVDRMVEFLERTHKWSLAKGESE